MTKHVKSESGFAVIGGETVQITKGASFYVDAREKPDFRIVRFGPGNPDDRYARRPPVGWRNVGTRN
jgi:hypothetical protein